MSTSTLPGSNPATEGASAVPGVRAIGHLAGFWVVAAAYLTLAAFGTAPTPLWPAYERLDDFGPLTVTLAFAIMVVGIAMSLVLLGHLSDRLGRRRLIVPALAVGVTAAIVLAASTSLVGLLAGRLLTGVAIGLMASTATAYLTDLYRNAHPDRAGSTTPAVVAGVAGLGGLALGPLVTGSVAEIDPGQLSISYALFGLAMLVLLALTLVTPETVDTDADLSRRPARFALVPGGARAFLAASSVGFYAFGVSGLFSSLGAIIIRGQLGLTSVFVGGLGTATVFGASAVAQIALRRLTPRAMMTAGAALLPVGLALTVLSLAHPALWLFLTAAAVAGAGAGLLFKAGLGDAAAAAAPASRAGVLASFFIVAYLGLGLPSVLFALTLRAVPIITAMTWFASVLAGLTIASVALATSSRHPQPGGGTRPPRL